jgi:hypothetical protein
VLEILARDGIYYPDFWEKPSYNYDFMRKIYPIIKKYYENKNNVTCSGLVFAFSLLKGLPIENFEVFYKFFCEDPYVSCAFRFWDSDYVVIEMVIPDNVHTVSIGVNDFTKLAMYENNDISGMREWELMNGISFEEEIGTIINKLKNNELHDQKHVQSHIHYISVDNIANIFPSFNYENGQLYDFNLFNQHNELMDKIIEIKELKNKNK